MNSEVNESNNLITCTIQDNYQSLAPLSFGSLTSVGISGFTGFTGSIGETGCIGPIGETGCIGCAGTTIAETGCIGAIGCTGPIGKIGWAGIYETNTVANKYFKNSDEELAELKNKITKFGNELDNLKKDIQKFMESIETIFEKYGIEEKIVVTI